MLNKFAKKTLALALATVTLSLPIFTTEALAAPHNVPRQRTERRVDHRGPQHRIDHRKPIHHPIHRPDHRPNHRPYYCGHRGPHCPRGYHRHGRDGRILTGVVIGAVLGGILAQQGNSY